jgi:tripeptide aminopeptidase
MMDKLFLDRVVSMAVAIQQIPAPTFSEKLRADFIFDQFQNLGLQQVSRDSLDNVFACLPGLGASLPLVISAHTDTVFPLDTDLRLSRTKRSLTAPGIGDNSLGVAGLFALVWLLRQHNISLPGDLWLVANTAEEGLGNLHGMRAVIERFGSRVLAYLVLEGMALGQVYHRALGVQRYRIRVNTAGGHSWVDFGSPSAINELSHLITQLTKMPLPKQPRTTLNVGVIQGGTSINTIASSASLELDLRSEDSITLNSLSARIGELVLAAQRPGVQIVAEQIGLRPAGEIPATHPLVTLARECLAKQGISARLSIGSTDANLPLSQGLPAICIGLTIGRGGHTTSETIELPPLASGLSQLLALVEGIYHL